MPRFDLLDLPATERERLCRDLLTEFGVTKMKLSSTGELIHSCCLPFGLHRRGDLRPSAALNVHKLVYACAGCGGSGGLLWFIGTCRGTRTAEARDWIKERTGTGGVQGLGALLQYFDGLYDTENTTTPIPRMSPEVLKQWQGIHPYFYETRHIPIETCRRFRLGFDRKAMRVVIPHFWRGDLVGWQTRRLANDGSPKYLSTPDFPKSQTIYHYDMHRDPAIVVESPLSVLSKYHLTPNIEATFGAAVTERQIRQLAKHRTVILFFDNDAPGWRATREVAEALQRYTNVLVVENEWAADPADFDEVAYRRMIHQAVPWSLWRQPSAVRPWETQHGDPQDSERRGDPGAGRRDAGEDSVEALDAG